MLHDILILPIETIIEIVYLLFSRVTHSAGLAIAGVSIAVNVLTLPLYAKAERLQVAERDIQRRLKPKLDDIKAVFRGDERLMILSTYYRQNNYHPIYALRSSLGLLLQVPFFIAAYSFLAALPELRGLSFLFLNDLSVPDGLFRLGAIRLNVLPIAMTVLNIAASAIYARGLVAREKVQLYGMAAFFLVLLYNSPSGLVFYWTCNNLFSLFKNIVYRMKRPLWVFYGLMTGGALLGVAAAWFVLDTTNRKRAVITALAGLILASPLLIALGRRILDRILLPGFSRPRERLFVFLFATLGLAILAGVAIPTRLIASSPQEFVFAESSRGPSSLLIGTLGQALGFFFFWPLLLYALAGPRMRTAMAAIWAFLGLGALGNVFIFGGNYGTISPQLLFQSSAVLRVSSLQSGITLFVLTVLGLAVLGAAGLRRTRLLVSAEAILLVGLLSISAVDLGIIARGVARLELIHGAEGLAQAGTSFEPIFPVSRRGKNVFVIMADRAISAFIPFAMEDDPELAERFRGFVWYPNTVSFNGHTLAAAPALFGGYEYSPDELNRRSTESLVSKHNEALAVMPRAFADAGWRSTITDASWANYSWVPDNSIFQKYPGVRALNLEGRYTHRWLAEHGMETDPTARLNRCLIRFSLLKIAPPPLRYGLYDQGKWWDSRYEPDEYSDFIDAYAPLDYLPELLSFDEGGDCFTLIVSNVTHGSFALDWPSYTPARNPRTPALRRFDDEFTWKTYQVNMAALRLIADFLDRLRSEGAYENSKIIIVADHGSDMTSPAFSDFPQQAEHLSAFNPLLLVKDFHATGSLTPDSSFRTNADTPAIALSHIPEAKNPFTGKVLRQLPSGAIVRIVDKGLYDPSDQKRNILDFAETDIVSVHTDIFSPNNWKLRP